MPLHSLSKFTPEQQANQTAYRKMRNSFNKNVNGMSKEERILALMSSGKSRKEVEEYFNFVESLKGKKGGGRTKKNKRTGTRKQKSRK